MMVAMTAGVADGLIATSVGALVAVGPGAIVPVIAGIGGWVGLGVEVFRDADVSDDVPWGRQLPNSQLKVSIKRNRCLFIRRIPSLPLKLFKGVYRA
jgi:hypothetical protein